MKTLMMMAVFISNSAFAYSEIQGFETADMVVEYVSWCDGNSVIGQDEKGDLFVRANCGDLNMRCRASQFYRNNRSVVTAMCSQD